MFSLKNIRDLFFTMMNLSKAQDRICDNEMNISDLWDKCKQLTGECDRLDKKIDQNRKELDTQHQVFHQEFDETQANNENIMDQHDQKLKQITQTLKDY